MLIKLFLNEKYAMSALGGAFMREIRKTIVLVVLTSFLFYLWSGNFPLLQQQVSAESEEFRGLALVDTKWNLLIEKKLFLS